jgi:hypothetical protein
MRHLLVVFFNLFGAPEAIAAQHTLSRKAHALAFEWLRAGEALLRRLLLIEAAALAPPVSSRRAVSSRMPRQKRPYEFFADKPEDWRVTFRCCVGDTHAPGARMRTRPRCACVSPTRFPSAWPLAERAEAMLRAFNNPAPYAARLARKLYAAPHRARALAAYPLNAPNRIGREEFEQTEAPTIDAARHFEPG